MMYVIYNNDGSIKSKFLNEFVMQGNAYENVLFVAFEGRSAGSYTLFAEFRLPNGSTTTVASGSTPTTRAISGLGLYTGKCISLSDAETLVAGALQMNIKILTTDTEKVLVSFSTYITINETGLQPSDPVLITAQEYQNLLTMIGSQVTNYQTILKGISLASFGDLTQYTVGQALYVVNSVEAKLYEIDSNYAAHLVVDLLDHYTKAEVDTMMSGKLNKQLGTYTVYAVNGSNEQTMIGYNVNLLGDTLAMRDVDGCLRVGTPTINSHAATKKYVDDAINTYAAYYITKNAQGDAFATRAELMAATTFYSGGVVRTPTRNDYCYVLADENHDNASTRYIYDNGWEFQIVINETAFTQAQLDAINSGATAAKISDIANKVDKTNGVAKVYATNGSGNQTTLDYGMGASQYKLVQRAANGQINVPETPTSNEHAASKKYVDTNFVANSNVKDTYNTTATSIYSVTYINQQLNGINEKASGLCRNFTTVLSFHVSDIEDLINNDAKVRYYDSGEWKAFASVAEYTTWRTGKSIGSGNDLNSRINDIQFSDIMYTNAMYWLFIDANEEYYLVTLDDYDKLFKANDNILIPDTDCADRWVFGSHLYALETSKLGYHALGTTSDPMPFISTETLSGTTPSVSLDSLKTYKCSSALTSLTISSLVTDTNDENPSWQIQFVADTGFSVTLPVGCTWKYGTPTFNVGDEYTIIIEKRINNDYYACLL